MRAEKGQQGGFLRLLALPLIIKVLGKRVMRAQKEVRRGSNVYIIMDHMDKKL